MDAAQRRLLPTMPLHAITAQFGEPGLRARLMAEIEPFAAPDRARAERALAAAARVHAPDRRQHEPYLSHLLRVAIRIIHYYRVTDPEVVCAALLHDAVEDHPVELAAALGAAGAGGGVPPRDAALAALADQFSPRVADLVAAVTNPDYERGRSEHEQYREHVAESLAASPWARVIKVSDFTDNGVGLIYTSGPVVPRLAAKYAPLVPVLAGLIARPDTPLDDDVKELILGQLAQARERFAAIGAGPVPPVRLEPA
jgi:hypothetical protein